MQIIDEYDGHIDTCNQFFWKVENQGYYWNTSTFEHEMILHRNSYDGPCHFIAPLTPSSSSEKKKNRTSPAFKQFIALDGTPDSFIQFVNQFGPLFEMMIDSIIKKRESPLFTDNFSKEQYEALNVAEITYKDTKYYHSYHFYKEAHTEFTIANNLFNLIKTDDYEGLYNFFIGTAIPNEKNAELSLVNFHVHGKLQSHHSLDHVYINSSYDLKSAIAQLLNSNWALYLYPKAPSDRRCDTIELFSFLFSKQKLTPTFIKTLASTWLDFFLSRKTIGKSSEIFKCGYGIQYSQIKNSWFPLIKPNSLLAAMWYQLSEEIAGNRKYKQCEFCHHWQDVTDNNENWRYHADCGSKERVNRYRRKKREQKEGNKNGGNN